MCSDITTEAEKVEEFVNNLYGHQKQLDNDVKDILAATILRFYHEFTVLLSNQPDGKFSGDNIFHNQFAMLLLLQKRMQKYAITLSLHGRQKCVLDLHQEISIL